MNDHIQTTTKEWLTPGGKYDITAEEAITFVKEAKTKIEGVIEVIEGLIKMYEPAIVEEILKLKDIAEKLIKQL